VLVRPDDFVGWRARTDASASAEELGKVFTRMLARSAADAGAPRT
jgi:hypothetical protein